MQVYQDRDINREALANKKIAIIGYGSQGWAQAQNLRDSGCDVVVGLRPDSKIRAKAEADGFTVFDAAEASFKSDIIVMLTPDELAPAIYREEIAPNLSPGNYLGFAHGFAIHYRKILPPPDINVFMVAPKGPGQQARSEYLQGRGLICLLAVHQDATGDTKEVGLAYASAIGGGRAGVIETNFREETETDLFGEQAVLCGGLTSLVKAGFETLVEAGYAPEMAYFECLHEVKLIVDLMYVRGIAGMRNSISNTAKYGDLTRGPEVIDGHVRQSMRRLLADIQSGAFADEWLGEHDAGQPLLNRLKEEAKEHPIEEIGERLRALMPWLSK